MLSAYFKSASSPVVGGSSVCLPRAMTHLVVNPSYLLHVMPPSPRPLPKSRTKHHFLVLTFRRRVLEAKWWIWEGSLAYEAEVALWSCSPCEATISSVALGESALHIFQLSSHYLLIYAPVLWRTGGRTPSHVVEITLAASYHYVESAQAYRVRGTTDLCLTRQSGCPRAESA